MKVVIGVNGKMTTKRAYQVYWRTMRLGERNRQITARHMTTENQHKPVYAALRSWQMREGSVNSGKYGVID